ncbi:hypothetical protein Tco_1179483 [Tanacetum coccineum]
MGECLHGSNRHVLVYWEGIPSGSCHSMGVDAAILVIRTLLNDNPTRIRSYPEEFLVLIGLSRMWYAPAACPIFYDDDEEGRFAASFFPAVLSSAIASKQILHCQGINTTCMPFPEPPLTRQDKASCSGYYAHPSLFHRHILPTVLLTISPLRSNFALSPAWKEQLEFLPKLALTIVSLLSDRLDGENAHAIMVEFDRRMYSPYEPATTVMYERL